MLTPQGYESIKSPSGEAFREIVTGLRVIVTDSTEVDGRLWRHISFSRGDRMPSYDDMLEAKRAFAGAHRSAVMILPKDKDHVNCHPYCLHLFALLEGSWPLPDFTRGTGSL